ncbi:hypothetical protein [Amycolatopsis sp. H20-H5]|uniref:hypothetical protein n=1 Tax=Amycolatopsis sp. H20-H5 TaxID=3046309 RepID=UPI002DB6D162|nr:hypothetical protein [Amycolatopsis sp. H20-H5]MEC3978177.1 hypothetical protein [Amycolatopsis sp. H20-H5]
MSNGYNEWVAKNSPNAQMMHAVERWRQAEIFADDAMLLAHDVEDWLLDGSLSKPDLVKCLAFYGKSRLFTQGWIHLPIAIPESERDRWIESGLQTTISAHREYQASAIGGFLEVASRVPALVHELDRQIQRKILTLANLLAKSLDHYTPEDWPARITEGFEIDDGQFLEQDVFDEPVALFEELTCFAWALEKARMFSLSEHNDELGLPNQELHDALMKIDLNELNARLQDAEPKLRRILKHLASHNYFDLNYDVAPDQFWWRHWKGRQADNRRSK